MKFKDGDEVRLIKVLNSGGGSDESERKHYTHKKHECMYYMNVQYPLIVSVAHEDSELPYHLKQPNGMSIADGADYGDEELELFSIKTNMIKLGPMMTRLLDKDVQKLVKVGFINGNLDLTDEGKKALMTILFTKEKAELVKIADEMIAEEKESK